MITLQQDIYQVHDVTTSSPDMRFLIYGDLQAGLSQDRLYNDPSKSLQDWRVSHFLTFLKKTYKDRKCDGLIDLGDTTDDRSSIPIPTLDTLLTGLIPFKGKENYKLLGNHEHFYRNASIDCGKLFEPYFEVIAGVDSHVIDGTLFVFASFSEDNQELAQKIVQAASDHRGKKVLLGHFELFGTTQSGSGIPFAATDPFDLVFLGHIHKPHSPRENVYYVGSPFQQDFGEAGESKRVAVLDTTTLALEWIPVKGFPEYRTVTGTDFLAQFRAEEHHRYRVILKDAEESSSFFADPRSKYAVPIYSYNREISSDSTQSLPWASSRDGILRAFVEQNPLEGLTTEELMTQGMELLGS